MSEKHIIGNINWTWTACDDCAKSDTNGGSCDGGGYISFHVTDADRIACDEFEEVGAL